MRPAAPGALVQCMGSLLCSPSAAAAAARTVPRPHSAALILPQMPFEVEAAGTHAADSISASALIKSKYGAGRIELARACLRRGLWQLHGNLPMHMGRL